MNLGALNDDAKLLRTFSEGGIAIVERALEQSDLARFADAFLSDAGGGARHGRIPADVLAYCSAHPVLRTIARLLNSQSSRLVRIIAFDKTPQANWFVPWHQDRAIAVGGRAELPGYQNWTIKDGALHVEPPIVVLECMLTLRVHLDPCGEDDGPLEVVLGSHGLGRLDKAAIAAVAQQGRQQLCLAARGDILAMRPLIVHRSQRARIPTRRRVLHLEYAASPLPAPLTWAF